MSEINRVCTTFPASAGSISFAPEAQKEPDIVERIRCTSDYVSVEKILSAPGLTHIYELLLATSGQTVCSRPAADIIEGALKENDAMAAKAVDDFATTLARFAGGIGLVCEARGSVYLWGSMLRRMERKLRGNFFRAACEAKSRNSSWLAQTPVFLIRSEGAILRGAAVALSRQVH
ncbi:glucokinase [Sinorhizobium fredii]|uniref:glucokinase n=1 Tax=Rhizobium fredii TaxID=380 RepID=UPI003513726C